MCFCWFFFFFSLHLIGCSSRRLSTLVNLIWSIQICNCCQTGDTRFEVSIFALNKSDEHTLSRNDIARAFPSLFPSTFFYINQICVHSFIHFPFQFHWKLCVQSLQKPYGSLEIRFNNMQTRIPIGLVFCWWKKICFLCACNRMSAIELFFFVRNICAFAIRMLHRCCIWIYRLKLK